MKKELEKLLKEAERLQASTALRQDNMAKHFYGGQCVAYKNVLKLLPEEG